ncbi:MAG: IS4 family transposase [Streptomycetaceae bacterium]|nr:IS4 family transposase [Streptomycetaceae bacterium]
MAVQDVTAAEGRLTDDVAIGLLTTVFPRPLVDAVVETTGKRERRTRMLPAWLMVYLSMALWLDLGNGYLRVLRSLLGGLRWAQGWEGSSVPTDGAVSRARERLGSAPMKALFEATAHPTPSGADDDVLWRGLRTIAVDAADFDLPAGPDTNAAFAVPADGTLPQARLVALAECGSLAPIGAVVDSADVDERTLLERLSGHLGPGVLLLADRPFVSAASFLAAAATGAELVWRVDESLDLPIEERLSDGTYRSELHGVHGRDRASVRVVEYHVAADDGTCERVVLITTLTSPERAPALELAQLYAGRWHIRIILRLVKADLRRPGGVLRSRTAEGVRQELWALLCVYQALRQLVAKSAVTAEVTADRIRLPSAKS